MQDKLTQLFNNYLSGKLTEEERQALITLLANEEAAAQFETLLRQQLAGYNEMVHEQLPTTENRIVQGILQKIHTAPETPVRRMRLRRIATWTTAAILLISFGMYWWFGANHNTPQLTKNNKHQSTDIAPGEEKAVLILSNGTSITLDSATHGAIARQGNTAIIKLPNGHIFYQPQGAATGSTITNTMRTPRGGQYQLTLPDGTQVWLNAASSITYPVAFAEKERKVTISGEVYFEVASLIPTGKSHKIPFIVQFVTPSGDEGTIEVTGTHFNVNSYANEGPVTTTLLEGSVRVSVAGITIPVVLKPGQQARAAAQRIKVTGNADIDKVMAWKNGLFNFENVGLEEVMRQIERWYNVDVIYEKGVPNISFEGAISRHLTLSNLLKVLARADVKFRIEDGRRLVVLP